MNITYAQLIPAGFAPTSRVWIYQGSRQFGNSEAPEVEELLERFTKNWLSHGTPVKGFGRLFFDQFIVLMADETAAGVSGCSTDGSVRLMKDIEKKYSVQLFDRQALAFLVNNHIQVLPFQQVQNALDNGVITEGTIYFNNLVQTKDELLNQWTIPVKDSWLARRLVLKPATT